MAYKPYCVKYDLTTRLSNFDNWCRLLWGPTRGFTTGRLAPSLLGTPFRQVLPGPGDGLLLAPVRGVISLVVARKQKDYTFTVKMNKHPKQDLLLSGHPDFSGAEHMQDFVFGMTDPTTRLPALLCSAMSSRTWTGDCKPSPWIRLSRRSQRWNKASALLTNSRASFTAFCALDFEKSPKP